MTAFSFRGSRMVISVRPEKPADNTGVLIGEGTDKITPEIEKERNRARELASKKTRLMISRR